MNATMSQEEFAQYKDRRNEQFMRTHWPKAKSLLGDGKSPIEVARIMTAEGYWGFSSPNSMCARDIERLADLAAKHGDS